MTLHLLDVALSGGRQVADHKMDSTAWFAFQLRILTMAANVVPDPFIDALSGCQTIEQLNRFISLSAQSAAINAGLENANTSYHDPSEYHVIQIDILKRHVFVQHEGIILTIRRQAPGAAAADAFYLEINRDVRSLSFVCAFSTCFLSRKPAIDNVAYIPVTQPPSLSNTLWTGTINYGGLTLTQVTKLLYTISAPVPGMQNQYYHLFNRNWFWFSRVFMQLVTRITPGTAMQINIHDNRNHFWYILGSCCGIRVDGSGDHVDDVDDVDDAEVVLLLARYDYFYDEVSAGFLSTSICC